MEHIPAQNGWNQSVIQFRRESAASVEGAVADSLHAFLASEHNSASNTQVTRKKKKDRSLVFQKPAETTMPLDRTGFSEEHRLMLAAIGCKQPRSVSHVSKQVRFDIKEGLRQLLKETSLDASLPDKPVQRPPRLRKARSPKVRPRITVASHREFTVKDNRLHTISPVNSRNQGNTLTVRSGMSSNRMSLKMALMYKKEALQAKISKGELDPEKLSQVLVIGNKSAQNSDKTRSNNNQQAADDELEETDQETPQKELPTPQQITQIVLNDSRPQKPKAGSIFRMRSESPANQRTNSHSFSPQATAPDLNLKRQNISASMESFAGQIMRTGISQRRTNIADFANAPRPKLANGLKNSRIMSPPSFAAPSQCPSNASIRRQFLPQKSHKSSSAEQALIKQAEEIPHKFQRKLSIWQLAMLTQQEFNKEAQILSEYIQASKMTLQEHLSQDFSVIDPENCKGDNLSAYYQSQLELLATQSLKSIRQNLKTAMLDSFLPLINEIVELRQRLLQRKKLLKTTVKQPLKHSIVTDICARLSQKIVLKALYIKTQLRRATSSLFNAYYDLLVKKPTLTLVLQLLKRNVSLNREKEAYQQFVLGQMDDLRKVQVFDCWRRLKNVNQIERVKTIQSAQVLNQRKMSRVIAHWKIASANQKCEEVGIKIALRFREMRLRHQLFSNWVHQHFQSHQIRKRALRMVKRKEQLHDDSSVSSFCSEDSVTTKRDIKWLTRAKERSQEIFFSEGQDLLLQREHLCTKVAQIYASVRSLNLDKRVPLAFKTSFKEVQIPSQALLSNREQIYVIYPDHASNKVHTASTMHRGTEQSESEGAKEDQNPLELAQALQPSLQKQLLQTMVGVQSTERENRVLGAKYSVHAAFAMQQNLMKQMDHERKKRVVQVDERTTESIVEAGWGRIVPFVPNQLRGQRLDDVAPNEIYAKLERQLKDASSSPMANKNQQQKIPLRVQLGQHIREMTTIVIELENVPQSYHRAQSLGRVLNINPDECLDLTLTSYFQIAMQNGTPIDYLLRVQKQSETLTEWKLALAAKYLTNDLQLFNIQQRAIRAFAAIRCFIRQKDLKAIAHWKTKQVEKFFNLFKRWAMANNRLIYERNKMIRQFRLRFVVKMWRYYQQVWSYKRRNEKLAVQLYCQTLHTKAMVSLYRNYLKSRRIKRFRQKQAFMKFFKRRWVPCTRKRQILRQILIRLEAREEQNAKSRYKRQFEHLQAVLKTWRKRVFKRQMMVKNAMAQNHYKCQLMFKYLYHLRRAPYKTSACFKLFKVLYKAGLQEPFKQIQQVGQEREYLLNDWRTSHNTYIVQRIISVWHSYTVQNKIAKMFFKRKYLSALQDYIFEKNYIKPMSLRDQLLKRRALIAFVQVRKMKWRKQRCALIERALDQKRRNAVMRAGFNKFIDNILVQKRKRIILGTLVDFRRHFLTEKVFRLWKIYRSQKRRERLMMQVADEFRSERIGALIKKGRKFMKINRATGVLQNENQDLMQMVYTNWQLATNIDRRNNAKMRQLLNAKQKLLLVKCFLSWRSVARFDQSDLSQNNVTPKNIVVSSSYQETTPPTPISSLQTPRNDITKEASLQQILARFSYEQRPLKNGVQTVTAQILNSDIDSPEFPQHVVADYTDTSLLKSDISSIYIRQQADQLRKKSAYLNKRGNPNPVSRNSAKESSKNKKSRNSSRSAEQKQSKISKPTPRPNDMRSNSSRASYKIDSKKVNKRSLKPQIEKIGKIAKALVTVNPHHFTLGQNISQSSLGSKLDSHTYSGHIQSSESRQQYNTGLSNTRAPLEGHVTSDYYTNQLKSEFNQGSITISNQTDLYQELESIYRQNNEWLKEHVDREKLLRQMAPQYEEASSMETANLADSKLSFQETSLQDSSYLPEHMVESQNAYVNPMQSSRI